jgi:hypothetical protein
MTKKVFQLVASVIRANVDDVNLRYTLADKFACEFALVNQRFDRMRFLEACGAFE